MTPATTPVGAVWDPGRAAALPPSTATGTAASAAYDDGAPHGGQTYSDVNVRTHLYADVPGIDREDNATRSPVHEFSERGRAFERVPGSEPLLAAGPSGVYVGEGSPLCYGFCETRTRRARTTTEC